MAWMSDEKYTYIQDCKKKKSVAASAFKARTHCGKGGRVKLPSDYLSKKELKAMNGECKSYRLNAPMPWAEFKSMPDDLKVCYIKGLREKFNVPVRALAEMFNVSAPVVSAYLKCLGLAEGKGASASKRLWNKEGFLAWLHGADPDAVKPSEDAVEETVEEAKDEDVKENVEYDYSLGIPDELIGKEIDTWPDGFEIPCAGPIQEVKTKTDSGSVTDVAFANHAEHVDKIGQYLADKYKGEVDNHCNYASDCMKKRIGDAGPIAFAGNPLPVIPKSGAMSFENNWSDDILVTMKTLLSGVRVNMHISWEVVNEEEK